MCNIDFIFWKICKNITVQHQLDFSAMLSSEHMIWNNVQSNEIKKNAQKTLRGHVTFFPNIVKNLNI
jgi:hypothetical protein